MGWGEGSGGVECAEGVEGAADRAEGGGGGAGVVGFRNGSWEKVFPMVAGGGSNSDVQGPPFQT